MDVVDHRPMARRARAANRFLVATLSCSVHLPSADCPAERNQYSTPRVMVALRPRQKAARMSALEGSSGAHWASQFGLVGTASPPTATRRCPPSATSCSSSPATRNTPTTSVTGASDLFALFSSSKSESVALVAC
jgi:hypothetical protein